MALTVIGICELLIVVYSGQLGTKELQGTGLAFVVLNMFGFAIMVGFTYGYEILGP